MIGGFVLVLVGASLSAFLAGLGSAMGCRIAGEAAAGVTTEDPSKFGRLFLLQALPGTQGFYGLAGLFLILGKLAGVEITAISIWQGIAIIASALPVGIVGLGSGIWQGKVSASGCSIVAKRPEEVGKAMIYAVVIETYAVLGLLATILILNKIQLG